MISLKQQQYTGIFSSIPVLGLHQDSSFVYRYSNTIMVSAFYSNEKRKNQINIHLPN